MKNSAVDVLLAQAGAHRGAGRTADAVEACRRAIELGSDDAVICNAIGTLLSDCGQFEEAARMYTRALELMPDAAAAAYNLGNALRSCGRNDQAIDAYRRAVDLRGDFLPAVLNLSALLQAMGRPDEAIGALRGALSHWPNEARLHYSLGCALDAARQFDAAIASYEQALQIDPRMVEAWHNSGTARLSRGRDGDAAAAAARLQQALALRPDDAKALANLANAFRRAEQFGPAIDAARRSLQIEPDMVDGLLHLSLALADMDQLDEARRVASRAVEIAPGHAEAYLALGYILKEQRELTEAIAAHEKAIALRGNDAEAYMGLAGALQGAERFDEAIEAYDKALELRPMFAEAMQNRGTALLLRAGPGDLEAGIAAFEQALAWQADYAWALCNLGVAMVEAGRLDEAIAFCRRAVAAGPDDDGLKCGLAYALLTSGELKEGFELHEFRYLANQPPMPREFSQPRWDGGELENKRILIHAEQGIGDTIHFVRYVPLVAKRGGRVILECPGAVHRLLANFPGVEILTKAPAGDASHAVAFDVQCPLMSLPLIFGTTLETIPADVPYLFADAARAAVWKTRIAAAGEKRLNVGVVWAGNPAHKDDRRRSIAAGQLAPLAKIPGVRLFSLQKRAARGPAANARAISAEMGFIDWTEELVDYAETAALVAKLDLVVSVDTSVAHLAGAMGRPVWVLIASKSDWRWLSECQDSSWYPTMRLFRQRQIGDWSSVVDELVAAMADLIRERRP
jgi:tetratricopeptide (TPR) repeat protein